LKPDGLNGDDLELELIDFGLEELGEGTGENGEDVLVIRVSFTDFGKMQKALEDKSIVPLTAELEWIPTTTVPVNDAQAEDVSKLIERLEQDDDVQKVFWATGAALFIRSSVWKECGGFDAGFFAHQEEIDLGWRIQLAGSRIYSCPSSVVYHVGGGTLQKGNSRLY